MPPRDAYLQEGSVSLTEPSETHLDDESEDLPELMKPWERLIASLVGVIAGGAGGYAVFSTPNQAGTAVLLVIAAAFLLIGVQGTPLIKLGSGANNLELERRRRRVELVAEEAREEGNPDLARGIVEGAVLADPKVAPSPQALAMIYEDQVRRSLIRAGARVQRLENHGTVIDMVAETETGQAGIVVKYRHRPLTLNDVYRASGAWKSHGAGGLLLISSAPLSAEVQAFNATSEDSPPVEVITWNDERDDGLLIRALGRVSR
jgi:hypothetical protein